MNDYAEHALITTLFALGGGLVANGLDGAIFFGGLQAITALWIEILWPSDEVRHGR